MFYLFTLLSYYLLINLLRFHLYILCLFCPSGSTGWKHRSHILLPVLQGDVRLVQSPEKSPDRLASGVKGIQVRAEQLQHDVFGIGGLPGTHAQSQVLEVPVPRVRQVVQYTVGLRSPSVRPLRPEAEDHGEVLLLFGLQVVVLESGGAAASSRDHHARLRVRALRQELPH